MTLKLDRRTLLRFSGAASALGCLPLTARADDKTTPASSAPPPIEVYAATPQVDNIALSPDGKRVAVISQKGDDKMLVYFDIAEPTAKSIRLGPAKIRNLFWGDNDHVVIVDSQTTSLPQFTGSKQELSLARVLDLRTVKLRTLFDKEDDFYGIVMGPVYRVKIDGAYQLMAANYRMQGEYNYCLYQFSLDAGRGKLAYESSRDTEGFVVAPDGYLVAYSEFDDMRKEWRLYYNMAPHGKMENFKVIHRMKEALDYPSLEGLGRDGVSVVVYFSKGEAKGEYHEISAEGVLGPSLDTSDYISTSPLYHPVTRRLAGFSHHDDWVGYDYTDPLLKKIADALPQLMGDDYRTAIVEFAEDPRKMILYGENAEDAGTYYFADLSTGALQVLSQNYDNLPVEWITEKTAVTYKAADGLEIPGYLTLPHGKPAKDLPLIVLPHGGPQVRDFIGFDWQTEALASRGYAVLQPNFRGSGGYSSSFAIAGHGEFGRKMQTDLSDGVRYLVKKGMVDPKRVAIMGASYGGYAALGGATLDPGIYNCAVSIAGVSDPKSFISFVAEKTDSRSSSSVLYWKQFMGDPDTYDEISPVKQAARASCPILLIHGTDDTVVPITQSRKMESALKAAGKPVEFVTYKGQDHWETVGSSRIEMMKAALTFIEKHNPAG
ncbi:alpha/beta hydrolase family protein [Asticcacaulis taihuensis]|uniref:alpha/beta hydrolase family protein n=1 Tax=Asticcacaulis taihuensis TaxID=260084 RepID=UPI0026F0BA55|nr:S9 family peptidase [Asticcacaulis taihuensis]